MSVFHCVPLCSACKNGTLSVQLVQIKKPAGINCRPDIFLFLVRKSAKSGSPKDAAIDVLAKATNAAIPVFYCAKFLYFFFSVNLLPCVATQA